jgi:23S rRNA G2445 N2-methylase RlmL
VRFFVTTVPGLAPLLLDEVAGQGGNHAAAGGHENDGRADVVVVDGPGGAPPVGLQLAEDAFVEVASATRDGSPRRLAAALLDRDGLDRALSVYAGVRPLRASMTFRVIARVRSERDFQRTAFRDELTASVSAAKPRWRMADPADIELWALETAPDRFRLGLRLTTGEHRHRGGRAEERPGALRPAVAAAMVLLAGAPPQQRAGTLLDPCCGSGTILREAVTAGWRTIGSDLDRLALTAAASNVATPLVHADAARLPLAAGAAAAVVTNLPFGHRYKLPDRPVRWFTALLGELERVTPERAPLVFLVPESSGWHVALERHARPVRRRVDIRLLGLATSIWQL